MKKTISLILVLAMTLTIEVAHADFTFGKPENLGPNVNGPFNEACPFLSSDGLTLYYECDRPDGYGDHDIWQVPILRKGHEALAGLPGQKAKEPIQ